MGIAGLLPALKSIQRPGHIKKWAGQAVAVDGYGWLHRGTISCALDLALGKPTTKYVDYVMHRVRMLLHYGVTPYMVFDGDYLPSKADEEAERARKREASRKAGLDLLRQGKSSKAYVEFQKAVDVSPKMAHHLIDACRGLGVQCLVAPYEADAQMYYLERKGVVSAIISEDSDLLVFGCKNLITKMDQFGECIEISRDDFSACKDMSLASWTDNDFRCMAILSGCDYLANVPKMGLKTAYRYVRKYKTIDKVVQAMRFDGSYNVPTNYLESFRQANLTFQHQRVFCPIANKVVMCTEPESPLSDEELIFIGPEIDEEIARGVAIGEIDPITKEKFRTSRRRKSLSAPQSSKRPSSVPTPVPPQPQPQPQPKTTFKYITVERTITSFFTRVPLLEFQQNGSKRVSPVPAKRTLPAGYILESASKRTKYDSDLEEKENDGPQQSPFFQTPENKRNSSRTSSPILSMARLSAISTRNLSSLAFTSTPEQTPAKSLPEKNNSSESTDTRDNSTIADDVAIPPSPPRTTPDPPVQLAFGSIVDSQSKSGAVDSIDPTLLESPQKVIPETPPKRQPSILDSPLAIPESPVKSKVQEDAEDDAAKLVAQGWRQRYSFQPNSFTSKIAAAAPALRLGPPRSRLTPLQQIGANALNKAYNVHGPTAQLLGSARRTSQHASPKATTVRKNGSNLPQVSSSGFTLDRFLYRPS